MKGYKVFNPDWTCRGFRYEVGNVYETKEEIECCVRGFHFCEKLIDCFSYYAFDPSNKVAEIEALGDVDTERGERDTKCCTNKIKITRELSWHEVLETVNIGKGNSGKGNTGDCNSGKGNTGDCNSGYKNTGHKNSGNKNSGDCNSGNWNTGDCNAGHKNDGSKNSGYCNTGDCNVGDCNNGNKNIGNKNSGDCNSGNCNSGDCNSGNWNAGDWNISDGNNGCFNTTEPKINMFNKPSDWTFSNWFLSRAKNVLMCMPQKLKYVKKENMTKEEKEKNPEYETTGGFLKINRNLETDRQNWWNSLSDEDKQEVFELPNFDKEIFKEVTGIDVEEQGE